MQGSLPAGWLTFTGRELNPLDRDERFTGRPADAHVVLGSALEGFAPTPEFPEIEEGLALLAALETGAHL